MLSKALTLVSRLLAEMCGWLLLIVMGLIVVDLVSRSMSQPVYGVSESAMFVMIAIVYLGLPYGEQIRGHVRVEFVIDRLPPRIRAWGEVGVYLLASATMAVVLYAVTLNTIASIENRQAVAGPTPLLVWPVKLVILVALALYLIQLVLHLFLAARALGLARGRPVEDR